MTKLNEYLILEILEYLGICKCNIIELNCVLKFFPNYEILENFIKNGIKNNTFKNDKIYVKELNAKYELCRIHDDKNELDLWNNIKKYNLKVIYKNKECEYISNKFGKDNLFKKRNYFKETDNCFIHFDTSEEASNFLQILLNRFNDKIKFNNYCCSGRGISLNLK